MLNPPVKGKIQGLFKAFECFSSTFKANLIFKDIKVSPVYSNPVQACDNLVVCVSFFAISSSKFRSDVIFSVIQILTLKNLGIVCQPEH